jgi:nicotinate-nucleotide adenylyltransferase
VPVFRNRPLSSLALPPYRGLRIGLFGGSFNPAHGGHLAVSLEALKRLQLDQVWWMVSPQNPLKDPSENSDFAERIAAATELARHPRLIICNFERKLGTTTTAQTLHALQPVLQAGHFVWIMGADSFAGLNRWHDWKQIPALVPLAVFDRPGWSLKALSAPAARCLATSRIDAYDAPLLADCQPPAWCFLPMRLSDESSTRIRSATSD